MRSLTSRRDQRGEDGFTLVELVLAVAILGIISTSLIGIVMQYLKVTTSTSTRLSESTDQQFISAYWQQDVSSLGRRSFNPSDQNNPVPTSDSVWRGAPPPGNCGNGVGVPVVAFAWTEFDVGATDPDLAWRETPHEVAYVSVLAGGNKFLKRVRCKGGVAGAPLTVARRIVGDIDVTCAPSCTPAGALPRTVSMTFTVKDVSESTTDTGYTTTVTADRRQG